MADETKVPDAPSAIVVYAPDPVADAAPPTQKEAKAAAAQDAVDRARGYREVAWKPGVTIWQVIGSGATFMTEGEAQDHVTERQGVDVNFASPAS